MLTTAQIKSLKQVNISVDPEKTKERVQQVWKAAKNVIKNDTVALAGCSKGTVYRVFDTGSISIKLAIAIGQVMNVNPYYLTGELEDQGSFSEILLLQILDQYGYKELVAELAPPAEETVKPKRKYTRKQKSVIEEAVPVPEAVEEVVVEPEPEPVPEPVVVEEPAPLPDFSEEDMQALLHSLVILSKAGVTEAADKLARVKGILIS